LNKDNLGMVILSTNMLRKNLLQVKSTQRKHSRVKKWEKSKADTNLITSFEFLCLPMPEASISWTFQLRELAHSLFYLSQFYYQFYLSTTCNQRKPKKRDLKRLILVIFNFITVAATHPPFQDRYPLSWTWPLQHCVILS